MSNKSGNIPWRSIKSGLLFRRISMQKKLSIVFIFLIIIPISAANYFSYLNYTKLISKNATQYTNEVSVTMLNKLEDYVEDMKRIAIVTQYATDLQNYLLTPGINLDRIRGIEFYIQMLNNMKKDTHSIYIFDLDGNIFYNVKTGGLRANIQEDFKKWKITAEKADGRPVLISTQEVPSYGKKPIYLFTVVKEIKEILGLSNIGTVVVDANLAVIQDAVKQLDEVTKGKTLIVDEQNHVIYDSDQMLIAKDVSYFPSVVKAVNKSGSFTMDFEGEPYIYTYTVSEKLGWKAFVYFPMKQLQQGAIVTRNVTILVTIIIMAGALMISLVTSFTLTKPLRKLTSLMKQVQGGDLNVNFNVKYQDEVGILGLNFNLMLQRIRSLVEEVYYMQARKDRAELEALQSQINPHFMYNTLETIRMTAVINDDAEVSEMAFILGKLLRYSIKRGDETVTIQDELDHLDNYLKLQNYRFNNKFTLAVEIEEFIRQQPIIKLVLQPIVENAIFHGLEEMEGQGIIQIQAYVADRQLVLTISDNGIGMSEETKEKLEKSIHASNSPYTPGKGIGLRNVNERIKLLYGEIYGLKIESEVGIGTKVILILPYQDII